MSPILRRIRLLAALPLILTVLVGCSDEPSPAPPDETVETEVSDHPAEEIVLFYAGSDDLLHPESRQLQIPGDPQVRARRIVQAFIEGPRSEDLAALLPPETEVEVSYADDRILYVDLVHPELEAPPPSGSTEELLRVYGLVNTVLANVAEPRAVVLLWNGTQRVTFGGHVDTTAPLPPRRALLADRERPSTSG